MEPCCSQLFLTAGSPFDLEENHDPPNVTSEEPLPSSSSVDMNKTACFKKDKMLKTETDISCHFNGSLKVLDSYKKAQEFISSIERATGMHYVGHRKEGVFDRIGGDLRAFIGEGRKHIRYCITVGTKGRGYDPISVEYTGVPFIEAGTYVMDCHMGNDSGLWIKKRYAERREKLEKENKQCAMKRRLRTVESKKSGCPAKVYIKRILRLPDFKIEKNTVAMKEMNRVKIMKALKNELENVIFEQKYYILMPGLEAHQFHAVDIVAGIMVSKTKDNELHLNQIKHYLESGVYLPSVTPNEKKSIRISAKTFRIEGSTLLYIGEEGDKRCTVLYSNEERLRAFDECHVLLKSGEHMDCMQTLQSLKKKWYWMSMSEDVVKMTQKCHVCRMIRENTITQRPLCIKRKVKKNSQCRKSPRGRHTKDVMPRISGLRTGARTVKQEPHDIEDLKSSVPLDMLTLQNQHLCKASDNKKYPDHKTEQQIKGTVKILYSFQEAMDFIKEEERATGMHYVGHRKEGVFDKAGHNLKSFVKSGRKHIRYCISIGTKGRGYDPVPVKYTGVPFIEAGTYVMECHLGADSGIWNKKRYAAQRDRFQEKDITVKRRCRMYQTKKMGCPAKVHVKRILRMPEFKILDNTPAERDKNRKKIMCAVRDHTGSINYQVEYYVLMPDLEDHKNHNVDIVAGVLVSKGETSTQYLSQVRHYLETGTHARSVPLSRKKSIRKSAQEFLIEDGIMYYQGKSGCERRFVPSTEEEKMKAFKEAHILKSGQHFSQAETLRRLSESCYWTDLNEDAQTNFSVCQVCSSRMHDQASVVDRQICKREYKDGFCIINGNYVMDSQLTLGSLQLVENDICDKQTAVSTIHEMSDGSSLVVIASDYLNVEELGRQTDCQQSTINIFSTD